MGKLLVDIFLLPLKLVAFLLEVLGRTLAILVGLGLFGIGALMCLVPPLILIGAPLCLLSALLVIKAF